MVIAALEEIVEFAGSGWIPFVSIGETFVSIGETPGWMFPASLEVQVVSCHVEAPCSENGVSEAELASTVHAILALRKACQVAPALKPTLADLRIRVCDLERFRRKVRLGTLEITLLWA